MTEGTFVEQVGGEHYQASMQHWDLIEAHDIDYLTATATKYLARWRRKGTPALDLGKAASYIEKALKCRPGAGALRLVPPFVFSQFVSANDCHHTDAALMKGLLVLGTRDHFELVLTEVRKLEAAQ